MEEEEEEEEVEEEEEEEVRRVPTLCGVVSYLYVVWKWYVAQ